MPPSTLFFVTTDSIIIQQMQNSTIRYNEAMIIVGIDEVGRGCWAGPLVAGAAVLHKPIIGLKDSKS